VIKAAFIESGDVYISYEKKKVILFNPINNRIPYIIGHDSV